jgi:hypothetical protein
LHFEQKNIRVKINSPVINTASTYYINKNTSEKEVFLLDID